MASLKKTMFREYDIRGRESADELNEDSIYHIARGFAAILCKRNVTRAIVGHDARATSEAFHARAIAALRESGVDVVDIGTVTTPMSYWAQFHFNVEGLVMITASHNPAGWNGLKLGTGLSKTLLPQEVQELYSIIGKEEYATGNGAYEKQVAELYMSDLFSRVKIGKKFKVLVNTATAPQGFFAPRSCAKRDAKWWSDTEVTPSHPHYTANPDGTEMMRIRASKRNPMTARLDSHSTATATAWASPTRGARLSGPTATSFSYRAWCLDKCRAPR